MTMETGPDEAEAMVRRMAAEHGDALLGWARNRFADARDAEEVVSEVLAKAWHKWDQFDPDKGTERAWLFGILRTTAVDHFRRGRRHLRVVGSEDMPEGAVDGPADRLVDSSLVRESLQSLSDHHREAIAAAYFASLSIAEIAERFGIPEGTVKSRIYYGMRALRAALEERGVLT